MVAVEVSRVLEHHRCSQSLGGPSAGNPRWLGLAGGDPSVPTEEQIQQLQSEAAKSCQGIPGIHGPGAGPVAAVLGQNHVYSLEYFIG